MTIPKLFLTLATMFEVKNEQGPINIKAELNWRDSNGKIKHIRTADFGYSSGLEPKLTVEVPNLPGFNNRTIAEWRQYIITNNGLTQEEALEILRHVI